MLVLLLSIVAHIGCAVVIMQYEGPGCQGTYKNRTIKSNYCYFDGELEGLTKPRSSSTSRHKCTFNKEKELFFQVEVLAQGVCYAGDSDDSEDNAGWGVTAGGSDDSEDNAVATSNIDSFSFHKEYAHSLCIDGVLGGSPSEQNLFDGGSMYIDCSDGFRLNVGMIVFSSVLLGVVMTWWQ